jgi:hypothetical protein
MLLFVVTKKQWSYSRLATSVKRHIKASSKHTLSMSFIQGSAKMNRQIVV